jgi:signal transduction histidine kinase
VSSTELSRVQLQRLLTVGRSLVAELDLEAVLAQVLEAARDLTGARYAGVGIIGDTRELGDRFLFVDVGEEKRGRTDPPTGGFLAVPVAIRGKSSGNIFLTDKEAGADFDENDEEMLIVLADWAAVAIENARLYEGAERRHAELERAIEGLQATAELDSELSGVTDIDRVLEVIVKWGRALVDARVFTVLLRKEDQLVVADAGGELTSDITGRGLALAHGSALSDAYRARESRRIAETDPIVQVALKIPHTEMLVSPLVFRGKNQGLLVAFDAVDQDHFGRDDGLLLDSFATSASSAIANAESVEQEKLRLSIDSSERERRRWAMELHDETLQELGALKVMHENALKRGEEDLTRQMMERAIEQLERTIESLEGLITELRPATLDDLGVRPALDALIGRMADANGLSVTKDIDLAYDAGRDPTRLAPEIEATIYRLVQEALNNIVKHARASEVAVNIAESADSVRVRVQDDGGGFDPGAISGRFGLMGMRERVELTGGELEVSSRPGQGTRVIAKLPAEHVADGDGNGAGA